LALNFLPEEDILPAGEPSGYATEIVTEMTLTLIIYLYDTI
jgi:hypothetical protein